MSLTGEARFRKASLISTFCLTFLNLNLKVAMEKYNVFKFSLSLIKSLFINQELAVVC